MGIQIVKHLTIITNLPLTLHNLEGTRKSFTGPLQYHLQKHCLILVTSCNIFYLPQEKNCISWTQDWWIFYRKTYLFHKTTYAIYCTYCKAPYTSKRNYCLNRLSGHRTIRSCSSLKITLMRPGKLLQVWVI